MERYSHILHLNGYKISGPTIWGRETDEHIRDFLAGHGYEAFFVEGSDPTKVHQDFAATLEAVILENSGDPNRRAAAWIQGKAGVAGDRFATERLDRSEGGGWGAGRRNLRAHQVPLANVRDNPAHLKLLEEWMHSYKPEELFDQNGPLPRRVCRARSERAAPHERQPACQWWPD
jgi:xylulose-5-phosphate/fructose-6-phosphate phosphoketolase